MDIQLHRLGIAALLLSSLFGVLSIWPTTNAAIEAQHRDFMLGLIGGAEFFAAFVPRLRLPVIAISVLSKLAFVVVAVRPALLGEPISAQILLEVLLTAALVGAGAVFCREAWQEARWNGMLAVRLEL